MQWRPAARRTSLIAPLRPRLDKLHLAHPLRFSRLLFLPLDPVIVVPKRWQFGENTLPRTMILPMVRIVEAALGAKAVEIRKTIQPRTTADAQVIVTTGAKLWPDAADVLANATAPARWHETGMSDRLFEVLAAQVAALLRQAPAVDQLVLDTAAGLLPPDRRATEDIVRAVTKERADALAMLAIMIVSRLPHAAGILYDLGDQPLASGPEGGDRTGRGPAADQA